MQLPVAVCLVGWLGLCSIEDVRMRQMHTPLLLGGSVLGILCHLVFHHLELADMLAGFALGLCLLPLCRIGRGILGDGDALLLMATGTFLGWKYNLLLLWGALFLASIAGMLYLLAKRKKRVQIPLAPFIAAAFLAGSVMGGIG